ncbi:hypothetical protein JHK87_042662 [Glycine soja]|nr:hypothetical protein JHK87_042662 [Glycine soja]
MEQFIDNLPPMDLMRSEKMTFVQLIIPVESAHRAISYLGGENCKLRLWSIKSGELLFEDKFSDSVIFIVCYKTYGHSFKEEEENQYKCDSSQGAWLGSLEGLFYMS